MWEFGSNMMGPSWVGGVIAVTVLLLLILGSVIVAMRWARGDRHSAAAVQVSKTHTLTPRQILDNRYATGDLATDDYLERLKRLSTPD